MKQMISKNNLILISLLVVLGISDICQDKPQKQFYMSYDAISNRDYLTIMFEQISQNFSTFNVTYTDRNGSVYSINALKPHLQYNQHRQVETYHDQYSVNVTLGQMYVSYRFDIVISHENKNITGWARGRTLFDQGQFTKKIVMIDGALQWDLLSIQQLDINSQFSIQYSQPKLTADQAAIYIQLLNDYLGTAKIKSNIIAQTNQLYIARLKYHLNHQDILKNNTITYKYNNIELNYTNVIKDFRLNNNITKGLQVFLQFGLQQGKQICIDLPKEFDQDSYGGIQQIISMGTIRNTITQVATRGLFNKILDKSWEVSHFQFFMGDLGNFVQYANKLPAHDPISFSCVFAQNRSDQLKVMRHDEHDIYVQIPQDCTVIYKSLTILKISFDLNLVVRLTAQNTNLTAKIYNVGIYGDKYYSVDPNFVVTDPYTAKYALTEVAKGLIGKPVFGTGWQTITRKFPVIRVLDDYIIVFDPAQK